MANHSEFPKFDLNESDFLLEIRPAIKEFEQQIRRGDHVTSESLIARFPQLNLDKEALLEIIYTEFVVKQELGHCISIDGWIERFPNLQKDLLELFQVHELMSEDAPIDANVSTAIGSPFDLSRASSPPNSQPQNRIGDYELTQEIGSGSMGTVYQARQIKLDRIVALKTVNEWGSGSPQALERFRIEAEASARLQHPNIVQIYEVGCDHHLPYFSMEYVAGGNLANAIHHRVVEARIAARLTECLAGAIHYAHMQGIVHRDLKPANILLAPSDRPSAIPLELPNDRDPTTKTNLGYEPKLSDFGLAKRIDMNDQKTLPGHAIGTPSYMAPEQTGNSSLPTGTSCDIFSLGAVLYDMLTGRPPFNAPTVAETLRKVLHEDPISLCSLQASVPRDLETICLKCLQKEPSRRYAHDISLSKLAFLSNRTTRSRDLLEKCPPELNQLEWRYLKSTFKQELCDFDDFKSPAWAVAMSPDGKLVAASTAVWGIDRPSEICIWNIDLQQMMWTLHGHSSSIMDIEFSPDGKQLVSIGTHWRRGGAAGQIHLWNLATGESIWSDKSVDGNCVTFSRNRNRIPW